MQWPIKQSNCSLMKKCVILLTTRNNIIWKRNAGIQKSEGLQNEDTKIKYYKKVTDRYSQI